MRRKGFSTFRISLRRFCCRQAHRSRRRGHVCFPSRLLSAALIVILLHFGKKKDEVNACAYVRAACWLARGGRGGGSGVGVVAVGGGGGGGGIRCRRARGGDGFPALAVGAAVFEQ